MIMNKTGLVLSHVFVRDQEEYKFDMIEWCVNKMRQFDDFFVVLCGHGIAPPESLSNAVNETHWESAIKTDEIGRGHPHFCRKGFEICQQRGLDKTLKLRAFDYIKNKELFESLKEDKILATFSEQPSFEKEFLGDLLMFGDTSFLLDLWSTLQWDYSKSGLINLYHSMLHINPDFTSNTKFVSPQDIGWHTTESNWNNTEKNTKGEVLWGQIPGFGYYGGY